MSTRNIVPRSNGEGGIGTAAKKWALGWINALVVDNLTLANSNIAPPAGLFQGSNIVQIRGGTGGTSINNNADTVINFRMMDNGDCLIPSIWANAGGTTAVMVSSTGQLYKLTSSERYKKDIEDIDPALVDAVMAVRAVWHKLKDPQGQEFADPSFYGFIAEEMAEAEPRLVSWTPQYKEVEETVIDKIENEDGTATETPRQITKVVVDKTLPLIPDGVDYQRITPIHHNKIQRQELFIQEQAVLLQKALNRIEILEAKVIEISK